MTSIPAYCMIFSVMAAPVNQQPRPIIGQTNQAAQQNQAARRSVPRGVADAPTNIAPAQANQAPTGPGYIESGIQWLGSWVSWLFKKIFFCFYREDAPEIDNTPVPPRVRPPQLQAAIRTEVDLLEAVNRLTDLQRNRLYRRIGIAKYSRWHPGSWLSSYEAVGRSAIEGDPTILSQYLTIQQ